MVEIAGGWGPINSGCQLYAFKASGANGGGVSAFIKSVIEASSDPSLNFGFGKNVNVINNSNSDSDLSGWLGLPWSNEVGHYVAYVFAYLNN